MITKIIPFLSPKDKKYLKPEEYEIKQFDNATLQRMAELNEQMHTGWWFYDKYQG